ncbi:MAG: ribosome small subunit-dependent GTPase A [Bacteroidales bacterium]|nr:ribosome small subunit-dependent GTPase A [Bacteroidales bacterium]
MENGIVIRTTGSHYSVRTKTGDVFECRIKGNFRIRDIKSTNPIAVGDRVEFIPPSTTSEGLIVKISDRENTLVRRSTKLSKRSHIIAANVDEAFLIATIASPRTSTGFIDRFLVSTFAYNIPTKIIFNKVDIYDENMQEDLLHLCDIYKSIGYECLCVSAKRGDNIEELRLRLKGKTSLLAGHSGVGKSALINVLDNSFQLKEGEISTSHLKGKHTTTFAQMFSLSFGGNIIDTPGIKEFGMFDFKKEEVALYFPEMKKRLEYCQYYNCTHTHEPNCAIKKAVEEGEIPLERYQSYISIINGEELKIEKWEDR